jgi:hypothetical protein
LLSLQIAAELADVSPHFHVATDSVEANVTSNKG